MAMTVCKECKAQISTTAEACPQCGAKPKKTSGCALIVAAFLGLFVLSAMMRGCSGDTSPPVTPLSNSAPVAIAPAEPPPPPDPVAELTESKATLDDVENRLKATTERLKKYYGTADQIQEATADMLKLAIVKAKYEESKVKEEMALRNRADTLISKVAMLQRVIYASASEEIFVSNGMDVDVAASGAKNEQLRIKYVLMSEPLVYKFQNEMKIQDQARVFGFKKIMYTDGYDENWTVDLTQ